MLRVSEPGARRCVRNVASLFTRGRAGRRAVALVAAAALLNLTGRAAAAAPAAPPSAPAPTGQVTVAAGLTLDGSPAASGQTFFPGSTASAAPRSRPALSLGNRARLELAGGATLKLDFTANALGGSLEAGAARVYAPQGVAATLATADATVASDPAAGAALFTVRVSEEGTTLSVQSGRVEMRAGGRTLAAGAGESLRAANGSAPAPPQNQNMSGRKKTGLFVGIAAALAAVILVVTGRKDEEEELDFGDCPITLSPTDGPPLPCF